MLARIPIYPCIAGLILTAAFRSGAIRPGTSTVEKLAHSKSGQVLSWCPSCYVQMTETTLPTLERQRGARPFDITPFMRFLRARLGDLQPLLRNPVQSVSVRHLRTGMTEHGTRLGLVLGPSQFDRIVHSPFPVVHIETPDHIAEAVSAIYELGVDLPTGVPA